MYEWTGDFSVLPIKFMSFRSACEYFYFYIFPSASKFYAKLSQYTPGYSFISCVQTLEYQSSYLTLTGKQIHVFQKTFNSYLLLTLSPTVIWIKRFFLLSSRELQSFKHHNPLFNRQQIKKKYILLIKIMQQRS